MATYMRNQRCINGNLEGGNYSAPVPFIGLYTAAASLACLLMMLFDIITGLRARKRWLPCRSFSLNSFTLSLLSISAKVPVDLTTSMPSAMDQLSKLSGTTLIVIAMGFTFPSMRNRNTESWRPNFAAVVLFVVTVIVNICLQISTGVIVLFIPEHIITMFSMVSILVWMGTSLTNFHRIDLNFNLIMSGKTGFIKKQIKSMFQRIKICYANSHRSNIQFELCKGEICAGFSTGLTVVCLICAVTLTQAAMRAVVLKQLEFCAGTSNYGWSMKFIVLTQIISVLVGGFATTFRWLSMHPLVISEPLPRVGDIQEGWHMACSCGESCVLRLPITFLFGIVWYLPKLMMLGVGYLVTYLISSGSFRGRATASRQMDGYATKDDGDYDDKWILSKNVAKMNTVIEKCKMDSYIHSFKLLTEVPHSKQLEVEVIDNQLIYPVLREENVSYIHITILVDFIRRTIPEHLSTSLLKAYEEVAFILQEIESLLDHGDPCPPNLVYYLDLGHASLYSSDLDGAIAIFAAPRYTYEDYHHGREKGELAINVIKEIIRPATFSSIEDLYKSMEQLFVDMLHGLLAQLPITIFKLLSEEYLENYESKIEKVLEFFCRAEHLGNQIQWLFPEGSNITTMFTEPPVSETQNTVDISIPTEDSITVQIG